MSRKLLHINASARQQDSVSHTLSRQIVDHLNADEVVTRDLADGLPFVDETWVTAAFIPPQDRTEAQADALKLSDSVLAEVQAADTIVIGTPMYNFGVPAVLKAWIDQISRVGVSFSYTEAGPEGLLKGKKVIIAIATGGTPLGSDYDHASTYMRFVLGFLGITDVTIVDADGTAELTKAA